jgi:hypothetical protein
MAYPGGGQVSCAAAGLCEIAGMSELVERAIAVMRSLPPERQEDLAQMVLFHAREPVVQLTPEEEEALELSEAAAARGEFATDEEIRAIWAKHGL